MELRIILVVASIVCNSVASPAPSAQTLARLDTANIHDAEYLAKRKETELSFEDGAILRVQRTRNAYNVDELSSTPFIPRNSFELNWSWGPIMVKGYVDTSTFEANLQPTIVGIHIADIKGNLKDGIILNVRLVVAKGSLKFYLKGKQLWVRVDIDVKFDGKYHEDHKIVDFSGRGSEEE